MSTPVCLNMKVNTKLLVIRNQIAKAKLRLARGSRGKLLRELGTDLTLDLCRFEILVDEAITLEDERLFEDGFALFVLLLFSRCKLVHPAQFTLAPATIHIADYVSTSQHDATRRARVKDIDYFIEKVRASRCAREARRRQFTAIGQWGAATCTAKKARPAWVFEENYSHFWFLLDNRNRT